MNSFKEAITSFVDGTPKAEKPVEVKEKRVYKHHEMSLTERLTSMIEKGESKGARNAYTVIAVIMAIVIIGCLIYTVSSLPPFGNPSNPANNEVVRKYIMDGIPDTGATNFVAGMILSPIALIMQTIPQNLFWVLFLQPSKDCNTVFIDKYFI